MAWLWDFAKVSQDFHPLRVCAAVEYIGIDENPRIVQTATIRHKGTEKLLLPVDHESDSGICFPQTGHSRVTVSYQLAELPYGQRLNMENVCLVWILAQHIVLDVDIGEHKEDVPQLLMITDRGCTVQISNSFNVDLLECTQPVLLWERTTPEN